MARVASAIGRASNDDSDAVAEARDRLLNALDESPELTATMTRLTRSLGSIAPPVR